MSQGPANGPRSLPGVSPGPGLCGSCMHVKVVVTGRGSRFYLCGRSRDDARFPRYPPIPVVRCGGYEPGSGTPGGGDA